MIAQISEEFVWNQIVAKAWCDDDFMKRLLSDTRAVLTEHDVAVPADTDVKAVIGPAVQIDTTGSVRQFVLPARPSYELFEEDLGGQPVVGYYCYSYCGACGACGGCGCRCRCRC